MSAEALIQFRLMERAGLSLETVCQLTTSIYASDAGCPMTEDPNE
jgi:hypothetical protein